ncbi:MAG: hypothetical protein JWO86_7008 [Myxococcaceae bacterium]|nr:hypothetical protein [Myxococcaceae bacterium]
MHQRRAVRSLTLSLLVSALAVASGCSSSSGAPASGAAGSATPGVTGGLSSTSAVSGTRLRAKALSGGGAREVLAFHDTERNEDCTFQRAEDGRTRCLPASLAALQSGLFSDPACKVPTTLATVPTCGADAKYVIVPSTSSGCGSTGGTPQEIRKLLDAGTPSYSSGPSGCAPIPTAPGSTVTRAAGEVVPWSAFVEATQTIVAGTPVSEKVLVATDGTRQHLAYRDDKLNVECSFRMMSDGVTRCVPAAPAGQGEVMYSDLACTKPFAVRDYSNLYGCSSTGTASNVWLEPSVLQCEGLTNVYTLRPYDGGSDDASVYAIPFGGQGTGAGSDSATCRSNGTISSNDQSLRAISTNITASLPSSPRVSTGSDRLLPALVWPPASDTFVSGWHDSMNDVDCSFTLAADGKMRCLPVAAAATIIFTDDACKSPSVVAVLSQPSCIGLRHYARVVSATCPPTTRIYALGADTRSLSNVSVMTTSGQCGKVSQADFALDATEVDPAQFVEGVASVE